MFVASPLVRYRELYCLNILVSVPITSAGMALRAMNTAGGRVVALLQERVRVSRVHRDLLALSNACSAVF